jgi:hypothetical protein
MSPAILAGGQTNAFFQSGRLSYDLSVSIDAWT